ncbi:hypothetical protein [Luteimicrobium subarcticum]|uniref:Uncharacterized protein n=1 Tax=Luteimicrobium subarcticum TaxID=620910 RepID=A0A2M8WVM7_9MICO|nr:hypothetical protein [Luteimicrobium subarcticum]PJI94979.1 hypothetical protein CLV34_0831 [Luteimicrobium subarcticum]
MGDSQWQRLDGDADLVRSKGTRYQEIADAITRATGTLDAIVDDASTRAKSMDATKTLSAGVRDDIRKAADRYRYTGDALTTYADALGRAVDDSDTAATHIAALEAELAAARTATRNAQSVVDDLPQDASSDDVLSAHGALSSATWHTSGLETLLTQWQGRWNDAKRDKDVAAVVARSKIDEVVTGDKVNGLKDSFWDHVGTVWDSVYKVFKVVCDVAGILSIFLSWVPVLGQVLVVLAAVGAIMAVVDTAIKMGRGKAGLGDLLLAVGGAALTLFGGKAVTALARYAKARMVVQTAETLSTGSAVSRFGAGAITQARDELGTTGGKRAFDLLASPFVRGSEDAARLQAFRADRTLAGFGRQAVGAAKDAFPNPFTDFRLRALTGNQDVIDMVRVARSAGTVIDGPTRVVALVAGGASGLRQITDFAKAGGSFARATTGFDGWQLTSDGTSLSTSGLDAPWSEIPKDVVDIKQTVFG